MKSYSVEQLIMAASPVRRESNVQFTRDVMDKISHTTNSEISQAFKRIKGVNKKETLFMKLQHLPKLAVVGLAIIAALTATGTAYAIYTVWQQPTVHTTTATQNQFGRSELFASFEHCTNQKDHSAYEIKASATIDQSEVAKILQAKCEMTAISQALGSQVNQQAEDGQTRTTTLSPVASRVVAIDAHTLTLVGDEYNTPKEPLKLYAGTKYIVNGRVVQREDIKPGDTVLYHQTTTYRVVSKEQRSNGSSTVSEPISTVINYVIKMDLPYEYYGPSKQNQIAERSPCLGNHGETCVEGSSIELYANDNVVLNPDDISLNKKEYRKLQGKLESYSATYIQIKTSSGKLVTVYVAGAVIDTFNATGNDTFGVQVKLGDMLTVDYIENKNEHGSTISNDKISRVSLLIDIIGKDDAIKKY